MRAQLLFVGFVFLTSSFVSAETYVIHPDGTGELPTIQEAIDIAQDGDVIALTAGVFTGDGNWELDFLGKEITLRSVTGNPESCAIDGAGEHRGIYLHSGEPEGTLIEGITLMHCQGHRGGGIYVIDGASPAICDCIFDSNEATNWGGGLCCLDEDLVSDEVLCPGGSRPEGAGRQLGSRGTASVVGCRFLNNHAASGGGMLAAEYSVSLSDCEFMANSGNGGGLYLFHGVVAVVSGTRFDGNGGEGAYW